jgi:hypothetical protein
MELMATASGICDFADKEIRKTYRFGPEYTGPLTELQSRHFKDMADGMLGRHFQEVNNPVTHRDTGLTKYLLVKDAEQWNRLTRDHNLPLRRRGIWTVQGEDIGRELSILMAATDFDTAWGQIESDRHQDQLRFQAAWTEIEAANERRKAKESQVDRRSGKNSRRSRLST